MSAKNAADKLLKKAIVEQQKRIKPGECQKYVRLVLDSRLLTCEFGPELLTELNAAKLQYEIRRLELANCIVWERNVGQRTLNINTYELNEEWQLENQVVSLLCAKEYECLTQDAARFGNRLRDTFANCKHTVIVPHIRDKHGQHMGAHIELQVFHQVNVLQLNLKANEIATVLRRFTKAIAEAPYKQQRAESLGGFKKYLANDKKQCVRVENGNGYRRLWQQHLNRLPQVTLEVAEAIIEEYQCPKRLIDHFSYATNEVAISALAELKIKRSGPQPLQNDRRIGKVLSRKLHTLYTAREPTTQL